jgi:hypothetical protein
VLHQARLIDRFRDGLDLLYIEFNWHITSPPLVADVSRRSPGIIVAAELAWSTGGEPLALTSRPRPHDNDVEIIFDRWV